MMDNISQMGYFLYEVRTNYKSNSVMKALYQSTKQQKTQQLTNPTLNKRFAQLQQSTKDKEMQLLFLEKQVEGLQAAGQLLDQQIAQNEQEWKDMQVSINNDHKQEMATWMQKVQEERGLPEEVIEGLVWMEWEGGDDQICLSCFQGLSVGTQCAYLPCGHIFHKQCIRKHLRLNRLCPACQQPVIL